MIYWNLSDNILYHLRENLVSKTKNINAPQQVAKFMFHNQHTCAIIILIFSKLRYKDCKPNLHIANHVFFLRLNDIHIY
jgi:hypothetical protein